MQLTCGHALVLPRRSISICASHGARLPIKPVAYAQGGIRVARSRATLGAACRRTVPTQFQNTHFQQACQAKKTHVTVRGRQSTTCRYSGTNTSPPERLLAIVPYFFPFVEGLRYGRFFFQQFPIVAQVLLNPLQPLIQGYFSIPFGSLVAFFAIYFGLVKNNAVSNFVKFNAYQAILLEIVMVLPALFETVFRPPRYGLALQLYSTYQSAIWVTLAVIVFYAIVSNLAGRKPVVPFLSDAVDRSQF
eukprot:CAMPEP_0118921000 /NCGR_PEP_ID=MMETSP1169-20130426/408_1 /TAXON_ID=36882 /ORGANISM="Pyramimonas obovata, Strain CCMP722" /LENGTH=246 /DNA_ID=CAMNT_0006861647 /DNA_START=44 /DNA_END=784 /DNA_ORIENTATION=+